VFISLKNKTLNNLYIVDEFKNEGRWYVDCICACGNKCTKLKSHVQSGGTKSCGCVNHLSGKNSIHWKGHKEISGDYWNSLKRGAIKRGLKFEITIENAWEIFLIQDKKCALSGVPLVFCKEKRRNKSKIQTASLDRIESDKGYVLKNLQWVHKNVNLIKQDLSEPELLEWCKLILANKKRA
jgi:hypothetical protein